MTSCAILPKVPVTRLSQPANSAKPSRLRVPGHKRNGQAELPR
jgi:hypothetical protein